MQRKRIQNTRQSSKCAISTIAFIVDSNCNETKTKKTNNATHQFLHKSKTLQTWQHVFPELHQKVDSESESRPLTSGQLQLLPRWLRPSLCWDGCQRHCHPQHEQGSRQFLEHWIHSGVDTSCTWYREDGQGDFQLVNFQQRIQKYFYRPSCSPLETKCSALVWTSRRCTNQARRGLRRSGEASRTSGLPAMAANCLWQQQSPATGFISCQYITTVGLFAPPLIGWDQ